jgi:hypothetical protein
MCKSAPSRRCPPIRLARSARLRLFGYAAPAHADPELWGEAARADAAQTWLSGAQPAAVVAGWPFLGSVALAEARERGDYREASWLHLYENHRADDAIGALLLVLTEIPD